MQFISNIFQIFVSCCFIVVFKKFAMFYSVAICYPSNLQRIRELVNTTGFMLQILYFCFYINLFVESFCVSKYEILKRKLPKCPQWVRANQPP